jgi:molybdopterin-guanine dinucleotide biosynthesis protein
MADLRRRNGPPDGFPAAVISRVIIHVDGPPGAGKTTFVERLLVALDEWVLAVRCRRGESLRQARESFSARDPEVRRYRVAGASDAGRFTFPAAQDSADDFFTSRLLTDVSDVVVIEGDSPLGDADLRVFVAPPPAAGQTLLVRERRDRAAQQRARTAAMERLLGEPDGAARLLEQLVGGPVVAFARERPELLEQARVGLLAGIGKIRTAPPLAAPTEHWAVAVGYAGIEYAQLVVVNACEDAEQRRAHGLLEDVRRLRADQAVFDDVLGWRGSRVPITAVVADLADARHAGTRKAVARVNRSVREVSGRYGRGSEVGESENSTG